MRFTGGLNRSDRAHKSFGWRALVGTSALAALLLTAAVLEPSGSTTGSKGSDTVAFSALPAEARRAHALIRTGGPFPYSKDGTVFGNRERLLPSRQRGDYREYTVPTPQSRDRGAKRIVCAGAVPTAPEACYYTDDHYASFRLIAQ